MQRAACPRNGTGLQASARPARGDPASLYACLGIFLIEDKRLTAKESGKPA